MKRVRRIFIYRLKISEIKKMRLFDIQNLTLFCVILDLYLQKGNLSRNKMFIIIDFKFKNLLVDYKFHYKSQWKKKDLNKLKIELQSTHSYKNAFI